MPGIIHGFSTAIFSITIGFIISSIVGAVFPTNPTLVLATNLILLTLGMLSLPKQKYWSIMYLIGYLGGLLWLAQYFMSPWDFSIYFIVGFLFLISKMRKKKSTKFIMKRDS